jgi:biotin transporter BioY
MEDCGLVKKIKPSGGFLYRWLIVFIMCGFLPTTPKDNLNSMHRASALLPHHKIPYIQWWLSL